MTKVFLPLISPASELTPRQRDELAAELAELDADLRKRRTKLAEWERFAERAERELDAPADLRERTLRRHEFYKQFVASGERLRALLLAQLYTQPEYQPGYHHLN